MAHSHTFGGMNTPAEHSVLFVCLGNICRSPLAEGIFLHLAETSGVRGRIHVDSAGTGSWHIGERPDPRSLEVAERNGVDLPGVARQVEVEDFHRFDRIVAMDRANIRDLRALRPAEARAEVHLLRDHDPDPGDGDVPDPYFGGEDGFQVVWEMVHRSCDALLGDVLATLDGAPPHSPPH